MLYFIYFTSVSKYIFFICADFLALNCRLLDKDDGGGMKTGRGGGAPIGRRRRHNRTTTLSSRWSSRPLLMRHNRTTTMLSRFWRLRFEERLLARYRESPSATYTL
jgi:hypothetical protein